MFIKPSILIVAAILLLLIAAFIGGCSKHRFHKASPEKKAEWVTKKIASELDLDDAQRAKLDAIKNDLLAKHKSLKGSKEEVWNEVSGQIKSDNVDQDKLNAMFEGKETEFKEMRAFAVQKFSEFHAVLTLEQRQTLIEKVDKFHDRWHH